MKQRIYLWLLNYPKLYSIFGRFFRPKQLPVGELIRRLQPQMERAIEALRRAEQIEAMKPPGERKRTLIGVAPNANLGRRISQDDDSETYVFGEEFPLKENGSGSEDPFR